MSAPGWSAALAVAAAGSLLLRPRPAATPPSRTLVVLGLGALTLVSVAQLAQRVPALPVLVGLAVFSVLFRRGHSRRRRAAARRRAEELIEACSGLTDELRAGRPPLAALRSVADDWGELAPVADAAALGSDVVAALRVLALQPGAGAMRWVASAWAVSERSGAGLADALGLAVRTMVEDRATERVLETELASAQATARLLCILPLGVLLIGRGAGGDPWGFLVHTVPGGVCLVLGLLLAWSGLAWIDRIGLSR